MSWADWHDSPGDGYGVDVAYIETFFLEHNPARFSFSSVLQGQPPIDRSRRLSWVDLGCGIGLSACMVAAAHPDLDVWGSDFNPVHIERSRQLAAAAGLANCTFDEVSFADAVADDTIGPAEIDVAVIHGVYSWVSKANVDLIAEFLRRRLTPGGLVFLSHDPSWGWSSLEPLAEAMRLQVAADGRRHDLAFPDAARSIKALQDGGAKFFPLGPEEAAKMRGWDDADPRYAVHEYLVSNFRPVTFDEVASVMWAARCTHIGSLRATDHLRDLWVPPELSSVLSDTTDPTLQQMLRDLIVQQPFRRDLFRRGVVTAAGERREGRVRELSVLGLGRSFVDRATLHLPSGEVSLDAAFYRPAVEALETAPLSVQGLMELHPALDFAAAAAMLSILVDGGFAAPVSLGWEHNGSTDSARRMNRMLIEENRNGAQHGCLVAPAIGSAVASEYVEMLTLGGMWDGVEPAMGALADHVEHVLFTLGWHVIELGELIEDEARARQIIEERVTRTLERSIGLYARLGIC
ncbi:MAG: class I SAM-dependent methyltransferase [Actinomycetota bacterium]